MYERLHSDANRYFRLASKYQLSYYNNTKSSLSFMPGKMDLEQNNKFVYYPKVNVSYTLPLHSRCYLNSTAVDYDLWARPVLFYGRKEATIWKWTSLYCH